MEDKNIERLVPTRFFYNLRGLDKDHVEISYKSGTIEEEELCKNIGIMDMLTCETIKENNRVVYINLITLTPIAFKVVKDVEDDRQFGR